MEWKVQNGRHPGPFSPSQQGDLVHSLSRGADLCQALKKQVWQ
jgi:hypothetical protein